MKQLILIRHCQSEGQHKDSPLTLHGVNQAHRLALFLREHELQVDRIISSPFMRAMETIRPFANEENIPIEQDVRLEERVLSDEPIDDWLDVLETSFQDFDFSLSGGESTNDALQRGLEVLHEMWQDHTHDCGVIVTHGNLLSILLAHFIKEFGFEDWKQLKYPDVYKIEQQTDTNQYVINHLW